ncbi:MAG: SdpI family protein [Chloroflexi bacterium]|nr:SdpI family protein [Chloroflexota bacterium]
MFTIYFGLGIGVLLVLAGAATYYFAPRVGPNPFFGVRIGYAYASREVWNKSNRFGGLALAVAGVAIMLYSLVSGAKGTGCLTIDK